MNEAVPAAKPKLAKAKRGLAVTPPPIGYVRTPDGRWIKDQNRAVQDAVLRVFELYPTLGSLPKVIAFLRVGWSQPMASAPVERQ